MFKNSHGALHAPPFPPSPTTAEQSVSGQNDRQTDQYSAGCPCQPRSEEGWGRGRVPSPLRLRDPCHLSTLGSKRQCWPQSLERCAARSSPGGDHRPGIDSRRARTPAPKAATPRGPARGPGLAPPPATATPAGSPALDRPLLGSLFPYCSPNRQNFLFPQTQERARARAHTHTHTHTNTHTHTHTHTHTDVFCAFPALEGGRFARTPTEGEETEGESGRAGGRATSERQPRAGTRGARQAGAGAREVGPRGVAVPSSPPRCAPLGAGLRPEP